MKKNQATRTAQCPAIAITYLREQTLASAPVPRFSRVKVHAAVLAALTDADIGPATLTVLLVDTARSAALHHQHFDDPTATDVMTFPDGARDPVTGITHLGDLAVCIDVARAVAAARGCAPGDEITLYILHGLLHLLGYDDRTPHQRARMWNAQRRLLARSDIHIERSPRGY